MKRLILILFFIPIVFAASSLRYDIYMTEVSYAMENENISDFNISMGEGHYSGGNRSTASYNLMIGVLNIENVTKNDTTAPILILGGSDLNSTISGRNWTIINVTSNEILNNCTLSWNYTNQSMDFISNTLYSINKTNITNGNYSIQIYCNDTSNNLGETGRAWVAIIAPTISVEEKPVTVGARGGGTAYQIGENNTLLWRVNATTGIPIPPSEEVERTDFIYRIGKIFMPSNPILGFALLAALLGILIIRTYKKVDKTLDEIAGEEDAKDKG